jgi:hypothetical protein
LVLRTQNNICYLDSAAEDPEPSTDIADAASCKGLALMLFGSANTKKLYYIDSLAEDPELSMLLLHTNGLLWLLSISVKIKEFCQLQVLTTPTSCTKKTRASSFGG